jgi:hypothetical protein
MPEGASNDVYVLTEYAGSSANMAQVSLDADNVFGDDGGELQLATLTGDVTNGYVVSLTAGVDTATTPTAGAAPSGGGEGGGAPEGGGGPGGAGGTPPSGAPTGMPTDAPAAE